MLWQSKLPGQSILTGQRHSTYALGGSSRPDVLDAVSLRPGSFSLGGGASPSLQERLLHG